ncbi:MAG: LPS export ABC transporter periplasmic protein LptC [Prevotellaceae bacterium]|nr:LPS export ABC transporter periplasmic protein LptC [Prevotellaceae bacterium]
MAVAINATAVLACFLTSACTKHQTLGAAITERDSMPIMTTLGVVTFVSDSGITRYRLDAEEWLVYDRKKPSYWAFEKGVYVEQFDTLLNIEATIKADTLYYYDKEKLWKALGNVEIVNLKGDKFLTSLLYWDEDKKRIYSDRYIRIEQPDRVIEGIGFESNQEMTAYEIKDMSGNFYVTEQEKEILPPDTTQTMPTDSLLL